MTAPERSLDGSEQPESPIPMEVLRVNVERALKSVYESGGVAVTDAVVDQVLAEVRDSLWLAQIQEAASSRPIVCSNCEATTFVCGACGARLEEC